MVFLASRCLNAVGSIRPVRGLSSKYDIDAMKDLRDQFRRQLPNTLGEERAIDGDDLRDIGD